jgi:imidazolonepropionase-like amidohydrolase
MPCDIAIVNGTVLPMARRLDIETGVVTITGNSITAVGDASTDIAGAKKVIDARG